MSVIAKGRATMRTVSEKRRQVFKHALGKPHAMAWPDADQETQSGVVDMLCKALGPLGAYFAESRRASKRLAHRKRRAARSAKNGKNNAIAPVVSAERFPAAIDNYERVMAGRGLLSYVVLGVNGTTRALEKQARGGARIPNNEKLVLVVVCKGDVDPQMVAHFPGLAHAAHSASSGNSELRLIGVGKGAEQKLASTVCQQRVSVIGIKAGEPLLDKIVLMARAKVAPPVVPWIGAAIPGMNVPAATFHPMQVHELHTTAPILNKKRGEATAKQNEKAPSSAAPVESDSTVAKKRQHDSGSVVSNNDSKTKGPVSKHNKKSKAS
ncbi:RNase P and RNase MRP subunit [Coemansia sp. BCRC 34301]|nr:RNase P and RNase MRP subunit [Coemansia sp. BCRC 34301]